MEYNKVAIIHLHRERIVDTSFYHLQEIGLAKALRRKFPNTEIEIWMLVYGKRNTQLEIKRVEDGISIILIPSKGIGCHGWLDANLLIERKVEYAQINADNNIFAPSLYNFCEVHQIGAHLYIGTINSDQEGFLRKRIDILLTKKLAKAYRSAKVLCKTPMLKDKCDELGFQRTALFPVGLDYERIIERTDKKEELRAELGLEQDLKTKYLLFVGKLEKYKRPTLAIMLLSKLSREFKLIMIGKGSLKEDIRKLVSDLQLEERVVFIDSAVNEDILKYANACDYYLNFNEKEIYGMALLEAMSMGCVPLAIRAPGPEYIIENAVSGFLCENIEKMKEILASMTEKEYVCISENAINRVRTDFSWDNSLQMLQN